MNYVIKCTKCGKEYCAEPVYKCDICGGIIDITYPLTGKAYEKKNLEGVFRYIDFLPVRSENGVSLSEGGTPLISSKKLSKELGIDELFIKNEGVNPTGSFKDRACAVAAAKCLDLGIETCVIASSGNGSASMSAYAARNCLRSIVFVPESTPENKILQAAAYNAKIFRVSGAFSNSFKMALAVAEKFGWFNATSTFLNPFIREGYKTVGYEIYDQLGFSPDFIVLPVGDGPILAAVYKAFAELKALGIIEKSPRLICVQAELCSPIAKGMSSGKTEAWNVERSTLASAIADDLNGYEDDGDFTIECIKQSGGLATTLNEEEILASIEMLGEEGVYSEPAGAVGAFALKKMMEAGVIKKGDKTVIVVTGNGLKNPVPLWKNNQAPLVSDISEIVNYL